MGRGFYILIETLTLIVFIVQLFFAIRILKIPNCPKNFNSFYWYPIIGIIVGLVISFYRLEVLKLYMYMIVVKGSLIFHFAFLCNFIYNSIEKKRNVKTLMIVCNIILCLIIIWDVLNVRTGAGHTFANGLLFLFACYFFYTLMFTSFKINLQDHPDFILCCGVFLGCGLTIPFNIMLRYLTEFNTPKNTVFLLGCFSAFGYFIMNLFFLKALLCVNKNK
jgi:hypothetical protein